MKKEQILNNLTEAYNVLVNELSEDQMTELGYEGVNATTFCQNVLSRADNISYEESEKVYNEGIDFIIAKQLGVGSNIVSELLAHAAALLMSYGLTDEEYEEWQGKQRNVYSSLLHAVVGDVSEINIREMVAQASENACVRKMIKNIDLSARNGVCITDVGGGEAATGRIVKLFSQQVVYSDELIQYNQTMLKLCDIYSENWDIFLEEYKELASGTYAFSKKFDDTIASLCENYLELLNNTSKSIVRMLRTLQADSKSISEFTKMSKNAVQDAKVDFGELVKKLVEIFFENIPQEQSHSNTYLNSFVYYNHLSRLLDLPLASESVGAAAMHVANQATTDVISSLANEIADSFKNAMALSAFETKFKKVFYADEIEDVMSSIYDEYTDDVFKGCLKSLEVTDYGVFFENVPEDCRDVLRESICEEKKLLKLEDCEKINKSYVLKYPLDEQHYVDLYVWYGDAVGQIKEIAEILNFDLVSELDSVQEEMLAEYRCCPLDTTENARKLLLRVSKQVDAHVLYTKLAEYKLYLQKIYSIKSKEDTADSEAMRVYREFLRLVMNRFGKEYMPQKALSEQRELLALIDEAKFGEAKLVFGDVVFTSMHILHLRYRLVDCCFNLGDIQRISLKKSAWSNEKCEYFTLYLDDEFKMPYELTIQTKHADDLQRFLLEYTEKYKKVAGSRTVSEVMADNKEVIAAFEAKKPEEAKWIEELSKLHHDEEIKNHAVEHHLIDEKWKINPDIASNHPFYYYMVIINYANCAHYKNCPNNIFSKKKDAPPFGELENYFEHYRKVLLECGLLTNENNTYSWKNKVDRSKARYYIDERLITELKKQYNSLKDWYERTQEVYDYRKKKEKDFATGKAIKMAQKTTNVEVVSTPTSDTMKKPVKSVPVDKIQKCEPIVKASTAKEIVVTESKPKKLDQVRASIPASKKETNVPEIKAKKNQTGLMSILFGIVTWILLFSMIGIMLSFITAIIGIVFGIKGLFSKPKGKAIIGLIINALYVIFIIILVC